MANGFFGMINKQKLAEQHKAQLQQDAVDAKRNVTIDKDAGKLYNNTSGAAALEALRNQRSKETQTLLAKAMDQTQGINAQENMALRQNMLSSVNSQNQANLRALRGQQAASGIRGGVAGAQMAQQNAAASGQLATAEQGLVAENIKAKQQGLNTALSAFSNQENVERDQAADKLNTILTLRGADTYLKGAKLQAEGAARAGGGGKK